MKHKVSPPAGLLAVIGIVCWLISTASALPALLRLGCIAAATACLSAVSVIYFHASSRSSANTYTQFHDYCDQYASMSETAFYRQFIAAEISRIGGDHAVARKLNGVRMLHAAWYVPILLLSSLLWFHTPLFVTVFLISTVVFVNRIASVNTVSVICKKAKKDPDADLEELIKQELEPVPSAHSSLGFVALMIGSLAVVAALFFFSSNRPHFRIEDNGDGTATLVSYRPSLWNMTDIAIPETFGNLRVVAVDSGVFKDHYIMRRISLPDSIERIGGEAFKGCHALESFTAPPLLKEIRGNTFEYCRSLADVTLHDGIIDIHAYAFHYCSSLQSIELPEMITEIHTYTFANCASLRCIGIPDGVVRIAAHAFDDCSALTYAYIPDSVAEIRSSAFRDCSKLESIYIPPDTTVDERAFKDSPTTFLKKRFTDAQEIAIEKEIDSNDPDILYYIDAVDADDPDAIFEYEPNTALISDDERLFEFSDSTVHELHDYGELRDYLLRARDQNVLFVVYVSYSKVASNITHVDYFVSQTLTVDEMLDICEQHLEEE